MKIFFLQHYHTETNKETHHNLRWIGENRLLEILVP